MLIVPWLAYCKVNKNVLEKKRYDDYYNGIFAIHQNWILKSPFNSRVHAQKQEHGPYFEVSI